MPERADVQADHGVGLGARRDDRVPVVASNSDGRPMRCGRSGQRDRPEAARGVAPDLLGAELGIGEVRDAERDDPLGIRRVPLLEQPVVPRSRDGEAELGVLRCREARVPQNPVIIDGKFTDAHTPLMSMSRTRASTS